MCSPARSEVIAQVSKLTMHRSGLTVPALLFGSGLTWNYSALAPVHCLFRRPAARKMRPHLPRCPPCSRRPTAVFGQRANHRQADARVSRCSCRPFTVHAGLKDCPRRPHTPPLSGRQPAPHFPSSGLTCIPTSDSPIAAPSQQNQPTHLEARPHHDLVLVVLLAVAQARGLKRRPTTTTRLDRAGAASSHTTNPNTTRRARRPRDGHVHGHAHERRPILVVSS